MSTPNPIAQPIAASPSNGFSIDLPALQLNGQTVSSGMHFDLNLGTNFSDLVNQSFSFVSNSNNQDQSFLTSVINQSLAQPASWISQMGPVFHDLIAGSQATTTAAIGAANNAAAASEATSAAIASSGGGGCFITTAVCEAADLPDDCEELQILRKFRDGFMSATEPRRALVRRYYEIAPRIVARLETLQKNTRDFYYAEFGAYIGRAIDHIKAGRENEAGITYAALVAFAALTAGGL